MVHDKTRGMAFGGAILLCIAILLNGQAGFAQAPTQDVNMLPPTLLGTSTLCPSGSTQMLVYSGAAPPQGGINCVPVNSDGAGNLAAASSVTTPKLCLGAPGTTDCITSFPTVLGHGQIPMDDGNTATIHCKDISFQPHPNGNITATGNMFYYGNSGSWSGWLVFFRNLDAAAGTAQVCIDDAGTSSNRVKTENVSYIIYGF